MSMTKHQQAIAHALATIVLSLMVACSKPEQVTPASRLESKSKDDLPRIRELMEKEEARKQAQETQIVQDTKKANDRLSQPINKMGR